jgi:hypothetical protein
VFPPDNFRARAIVSYDKPDEFKCQTLPGQHVESLDSSWWLCQLLLHYCCRASWVVVVLEGGTQEKSFVAIRNLFTFQD